MVRFLALVVCAATATVAQADENRLTLSLISGTDLGWLERAARDGSRTPFGEGCAFNVDDSFVRGMERMASAGVIEMLDPDAPFSVVEIVVFRNGAPYLIMGGMSDVRIPSEVAFRLDPIIYSAVRDRVVDGATQMGC